MIDPNRREHPEEYAPRGGTQGYSYTDDVGRRVDVAPRREGERLDSRTIDQLRIERDAEVAAGLPTKYNQQTLVGNVSGAGNRHVIEDTPQPRRPSNIPTQVFEGVGGTITVQTRDGGGFGMIVQQVNGVSTITFDSAVFLIQDNGGGEVVVYCA